MILSRKNCNFISYNKAILKLQKFLFQKIQKELSCDELRLPARVKLTNITILKLIISENKANFFHIILIYFCSVLETGGI